MRSMKWIWHDWRVLQVPPIKAVLGGFSQASMANDAGAFTNSAADEQSCYNRDIKQFGHLLATLLGHCHGSSEYVKVIIMKSVSAGIYDDLETAWLINKYWSLVKANGQD